MPTIRGKAFSFTPLVPVLVMAFSCNDGLYYVEKISFITYLLGNFVMRQCWNVAKYIFLHLLIRAANLSFILFLWCIIFFVCVELSFNSMDLSYWVVIFNLYNVLMCSRYETWDLIWGCQDWGGGRAALVALVSGQAQVMGSTQHHMLRFGLAGTVGSSSARAMSLLVGSEGHTAGDSPLFSGVPDEMTWVDVPRTFLSGYICFLCSTGLL
jgi:hypothetical protein